MIMYGAAFYWESSIERNAYVRISIKVYTSAEERDAHARRMAKTQVAYPFVIKYESEDVDPGNCPPELVREWRDDIIPLAAPALSIMARLAK